MSLESYSMWNKPVTEDKYYVEPLYESHRAAKFIVVETRKIWQEGLLGANFLFSVKNCGDKW